MSTPRITELEHSDDVARLFRTLAGLPWPAWLDSAAADSRERFDILVADPCATLRTRGDTTEIVVRGAAPVSSRRPPLELLREQLGAVVPAQEGLPFCGGAVGYFGYDLGRRFEQIPALATADIAMPDSRSASTTGPSSSIA